MVCYTPSAAKSTHFLLSVTFAARHIQGSPFRVSLSNASPLTLCSSHSRPMASGASVDTGCKLQGVSSQGARAHLARASRPSTAPAFSVHGRRNGPADRIERIRSGRERSTRLMTTSSIHGTQRGEGEQAALPDDIHLLVCKRSSHFTPSAQGPSCQTRKICFQGCNICEHLNTAIIGISSCHIPSFRVHKRCSIQMPT